MHLNGPAGGSHPASATEHPPVWPAGSAVVLRSVFDDHVGAAIPSVVIADEASYAALYQPAGSTLVTRTGRRGGPQGRNMYPDGWDGGHRESPWSGTGVLRVHRRGDPWSVWRWWDAGGWRPGCYVNLEEPWRRTRLGFDTRDWVLDLVLDGDGRPHWKDADELAWCEAVGTVTAEHAARVRDAGRQALAAAGPGAFPFTADWDRWSVHDGAAAPGPAALRRATVLRPPRDREIP
ncbi:DUF402 domain-containing protein [Nakamurella deserti]|uniref:DUF402 domain-containing protein n=1 Tax=Nakamurella deserti TaxID=2164074 RepID=UPI0013008616|nr:DUF402 domain-containing protein [Nakamurella deserti]